MINSDMGVDPLVNNNDLNDFFSSFHFGKTGTNVKIFQPTNYMQDSGDTLES